MRLFSHSSLRGRVALLLLLGAGALLLTGCLGGEELGSADDVPTTVETSASGDEAAPEAAVLAAAATKTTETGSAKLAMTLGMALPGAPERVEISLEGAFDLAKQRGRLDFDYGSLVDALGPSSPQVSAFLPDRMIFNKKALYLRMPNLAELVPGGKKWVKLDIDELGAQQGLDITGVDQLGQADPAQLLALLQSIEGSIEDLGVETVRGQDARHYRATINMAKLATTAPPEQQALLQGQLEQLSQLGLDNLPVEVWIDEEDRVVRMSSTIAVPDTGTGAGSISFDVELYDFGVPVKVKAPGKKQVTNVDKLLGALGPSIQG
ncbi:MAG: hypothetical protein ACR2OD_04235 [Gaiellaceae bacterium]